MNASIKSFFLKSGQRVLVKYNSAYANWYSKKLLMRYSPLVLIISSGSGNSLWYKYVVTYPGQSRQAQVCPLHISSYLFYSLHQFPAATVAQCHNKVEPRVDAWFLLRPHAAVACVFGKHFMSPITCRRILFLLSLGISFLMVSIAVPLTLILRTRVCPSFQY